MTFHLPEFLPYLLNQASEAASRDFETLYRARYNMLRTEWRVLFHLGCFGDMTAKRICDMATLHKTKVSRAVAALEDKRYLSRTADERDRRNETLSLTALGTKVFLDLSNAAESYEDKLASHLTTSEVKALRATLLKLMRRQA